MQCPILLSFSPADLGKKLDTREVANEFQIWILYVRLWYSDVRCSQLLYTADMLGYNTVKPQCDH